MIKAKLQTVAFKQQAVKPHKTKAATLAAAFVDHGVHLVQTSSALTAQSHARIGTLAATTSAALAALNLKNKSDVRQVLLNIQRHIDSTYQQIAEDSSQATQGLAGIESRSAVSIVNKAVGAPIMSVPHLTVGTLMIEGHALQTWWKAQADDLTRKVTRAVKTAVTANAKPDDAAAYLALPFSAALRNAETLTHTATQQIAMDARTATFKANKAVVSGIEVIVTLDSKTCGQCLAYVGATYDLEGNAQEGAPPFNGGPPFHFSCRCGVTTVVLGSTDAPARLSAEDWLDAKSTDEQDEILGKGRAQLYRDGTITIHDLISKTGKQLSLADLNKKYNT